MSQSTTRGSALAPRDRALGASIRRRFFRSAILLRVAHVVALLWGLTATALLPGSSEAEFFEKSSDDSALAQFVTVVVYPIASDTALRNDPCNLELTSNGRSDTLTGYWNGTPIVKRCSRGSRGYPVTITSWGSMTIARKRECATLDCERDREIHCVILGQALRAVDTVGVLCKDVSRKTETDSRRVETATWACRKIWKNCASVIEFAGTASASCESTHRKPGIDSLITRFDCLLARLRAEDITKPVTDEPRRDVGVLDLVIITDGIHSVNQEDNDWVIKTHQRARVISEVQALLKNWVEEKRLPIRLVLVNVGRPLKCPSSMNDMWRDILDMVGGCIINIGWIPPGDSARVLTAIDSIYRAELETEWLRVKDVAWEPGQNEGVVAKLHLNPMPARQSLECRLKDATANVEIWLDNKTLTSRNGEWVPLAGDSLGGHEIKVALKYDVDSATFELLQSREETSRIGHLIVKRARMRVPLPAELGYGDEFSAERCSVAVKNQVWRIYSGVLSCRREARYGPQTLDFELGLLAGHKKAKWNQGNGTGRPQPSVAWEQVRVRGILVYRDWKNLNDWYVEVFDEVQVHRGSKFMLGFFMICGLGLLGGQLFTLVRESKKNLRKTPEPLPSCGPRSFGVKAKAIASVNEPEKKPETSPQPAPCCGTKTEDSGVEKDGQMPFSRSSLEGFHLVLVNGTLVLGIELFPIERWSNWYIALGPLLFVWFVLIMRTRSVGLGTIDRLQRFACILIGSLALISGMTVLEPNLFRPLLEAEIQGYVTFLILAMVVFALPLFFHSHRGTTESDAGR